MAVTLEEIAAQLNRIEAVLKAQPATPAASQAVGIRLTYTPREFGAKIGRSYRWVIERCRAGVIPTTTRRPPYLIPAGAADEYFANGFSIFTKKTP